MRLQGKNRYGIPPLEFGENPSMVPVRLNFLVAFLQFDPAPIFPWSAAVVTVDNGELTIV